MARPRRLSHLVVLSCALLAALPGAPAAADQPPLILISIDTLRADHLPAYGYTKVATPAIDALRQEAVLFESAYTPSPMTLPAHASMLSGQLPTAHGVRANMGYTIGERLPWLPRLLRQQGYATGAAVSSFVLRKSTGMAQGFDSYEDSIPFSAGGGLTSYERSGLDTLTAALPWLDANAGKPLFLFFHIYEPHSPYQPPERYAKKYPLPYDGEVAVADEIVGQLVTELKRLGLWDRAAVVLTSDHGDGLGDHGEDGHGVLLYRSTIQVPLLLKLPGGRLGGSKVATPAQLADLAPTFLGLAGLQVPPEMQGRSLVEIAERQAEDRQIYAETYYTRLYFGWSELRSLVDRRYQYIDSAAPELYDLAADPAQKSNLLAEEKGLAQQKQTAAALRSALAAIPPSFEAPGAFDVESRQRLESLGYVGGARSAYQGALPPPQTQMDLAAELQHGFVENASRRYAKAVEAFQKVLAKNEHSIAAWENLALAYERLGRFTEALAAYQQAFERSGGEPHLALAIGEVLLSLGRPADARAHAEPALAWDGAAARDLLARAALAEGKPDEAERQAEEGLKLRRDPGLLFVQGRVARQRGDLVKALALARQAEAGLAQTGGEGRLRGLYFLIGDTLARSGKPEEAEAAFQREIELFPGDFLAPSSLALLYASTERSSEAIEILRQLVARNPIPMVFVSAVRTLRALGETTAADQLLAEARQRFPEHPAIAKL